MTEKEQLVTEIHHRVKNNLLLISSLLESQIAYLHDDAGKCKSLGMSPIEGLSRALQAELRILSGPGTTIEVVATSP